MDNMRVTYSYYGCTIAVHSYCYQPDRYRSMLMWLPIPTGWSCNGVYSNSLSVENIICEIPTCLLHTKKKRKKSSQRDHKARGWINGQIMTCPPDWFSEVLSTSVSTWCRQSGWLNGALRSCWAVAPWSPQCLVVQAPSPQAIPGNN